jgi:predicted MFS family arabinose efflux permease
MTIATGVVDPDQPTISTSLTLLLAAACGMIAANLYYAQPLIGPISADLGISQGISGLIVTLTQLGYGLGLILIVPLADRFENRSLILAMIGLATASLLVSSIATSAAIFLLQPSSSA